MVRWSLVLLVCLVVTSIRTSPADDVKLTEIRDAWQSRSARAESLHVKFSSVRVAKPPGPGMKDAAYVTMQESSELWFWKDKVAVENLRDAVNAVWDPPRIRQVMNGNGGQKIASDGSSGTEFDIKSSGSIEPNVSEAGTFFEVIYIPLMYGYRFRENERSSFNLRDCVIQPNTYKIGDIDCLVLTSASENASTKEVWVDPLREFIPLRISRRSRNEVPLLQIDVQYAESNAVGFEVTGWKITLLKGNGELSASETVTVEQFDTTTAMSDALFKIDFPPGSRVFVENGSGPSIVDAVGNVPGFSPTVSAANNPRIPWYWIMVAGIFFLAGLFAWSRRVRTSHRL